MTTNFVYTILNYKLNKNCGNKYNPTKFVKNKNIRTSNKVTIVTPAPVYKNKKLSNGN